MSGHLRPYPASITSGCEWQVGCPQPPSQARAERKAGLRPDETTRLGVNEQPAVSHRPTAHLGKATLVIKDAQDAVRLQRDEVDAGLIVSEGNLTPVDLFTDVLLLQAAGLSLLVLPPRLSQSEGAGRGTSACIPPSTGGSLPSRVT